MATPSANQYFEAIHTGPGDPTSPNLFTAAELVAGSFSSAAVSSATSTAVSTVNAAAPDSSSISQAKSQAVSAATNASIADSKSVSNSVNVSVADSKALSVSGSTSIADSKAVSAAQYSNFPSAVVSTADSKAVSVATFAGPIPPGRTVTTLGQYNANNANYNALDYGIVAGNVGDQTAALNTLLNTTVPIGGTAVIPAGTYAIAGSVSVTRSDIRIIMYGAKFKHSGAGVAFSFDGQSITNGMRNVEAYGGEVDGNANTTIAWRFIDMGGNRFFYQRARNCSQRAFSAEFCVLVEWFNPRCTTNDSINEGNMTTKPTTGFYLGKRNVNENTSDCILYNPEFEGLSSGTGIDFQDCTGNTVIGGSPEGNSIGYNFGATAQANTIVGGFTEVNTTSDVVCAGFFNTFINCFFRSVGGSRFTAATCYNNRVIGGSWYLITIEAGVLSTVLDGVAHDLAIVDNGAQTQYRNVYNTPGAAFDPDILMRFTRGYAGEIGMLSLRDTAATERRLCLGVDNTIGTSGMGWIQAVRAAIGGIPLLLQGQTGVVKVGTLVAPFDTDTGEVLQVNGSLKVKRVITSAVAAPAKTAGTGAGTGPTITVSGTDMAGFISVSTGTTPAGSSATIVTVTFNVAYAGGVTPRPILSPANAAAAALSGTTQVFLQVDNLGIYLISGSAALTASTLYQWYYNVIA